MQWHPTILAKLALVEQRVMNSYSRAEAGQEYQEGDFVVQFHDCAAAEAKNCEAEAARFVPKWREAFKSAGSGSAAATAAAS